MKSPTGSEPERPRPAGVGGAADDPIGGGPAGLFFDGLEASTCDAAHAERPAGLEEELQLAADVDAELDAEGDAGRQRPVDDRRQADIEIVEVLKAEDFDKDSVAWLALADRLARYGNSVLVAWAVTGELRARAKRYPGGHRLPEGLRLDVGDARSLANEVLAKSLENFRTRSLRQWDPNGPASITTWFIGRCLLDLPDVFPGWFRRELRPLPVEVGEPCCWQQGAEDTTACDLVDEMLENDPVLRKVIEQREAGYTWAEIASQLGTTETAIKSKVHRAKNRLRKEVN
jgi:hypothetical protein